MKRSTFRCPDEIDHFIQLLNENKKKKLLIFDFLKRELWASDDRADLAKFEFPDGGKVFFAENESQANEAFEAIRRGRGTGLLALVRGTDRVKKL